MKALTPELIDRLRLLAWKCKPLPYHVHRYQELPLNSTYLLFDYDLEEDSSLISEFCKEHSLYWIKLPKLNPNDKTAIYSLNIPKTYDTRNS